MIVGFIVVFMAMYTAVLERTREIGIIKAVGGVRVGAEYAAAGDVDAGGARHGASGLC